MSKSCFSMSMLRGLCLALSVIAGSAAAAPVVTKVFSTTQGAYAADVSASDLLTGLTPATTGWNFGNNASPLELTDGIHGAKLNVVPGDAVQGAWTTVGATATYHLGLGVNGLGYNITSIQSIADWQDAKFGNQGWTVEVKLGGAVSYVTLATVDYQPITANNGGGATKVTLTDSSGVLATGVEYIRFTANSVNGGLNFGAFVWREADVFGVPTPPPIISSLSPADNASMVPPGSDLVATFTANIAVGSGGITIKNLANSSQTVIPVGDPRVSIVGAVLTIHPGVIVGANASYAVRIAAGAIVYGSGNPFAGIADDTTWNFTTSPPDLIPPTLTTLSPANNANGVVLSSNLVATFSENVARGSGNITIKNLATSNQTVIPVTDPRVSVSGTALTVNASGILASSTIYAVHIDSGAVTDSSGNPFAGIADDRTWNFTTATTRLRIMCLGDSITAGYTDNPNWTVPFMFGYRSGLYTRLTNAGYTFQLVGGSTEPWTGISGDPSHGGTYKPALDLRDFGQDYHRGYGGKDIAFINTNVASYIAADSPDVILLQIGINGIGPGSPALLNTLVNTIVTSAPNAHLIVAQITPLASFNQDLYNYNVYIRDTLVPTYVSNGKKVTTVNLYSLFLTDPNNYASAIASGVLANGINHPDNAHYDLMAQKWFAGIQALGVAPNNFSSWIGNPAFGIAPANQGFALDLDRDGLVNGLEAWFGTHPGQFTAGLSGLTRNGTTTTFTHPHNANPPSDLSGYYEWSPNLVDWYTSGNGPGGGPTVIFSAVNAGSVTTVTATASVPLQRLFLRAGVRQN